MKTPKFTYLNKKVRWTYYVLRVLQFFCLLDEIECDFTADGKVMLSARITRFRPMPRRTEHEPNPKE